MDPVLTYDLRECTLGVVADLCARYHGYKSIGDAMTYTFAVYENDRPVAAYAWQPPAPGSARSVCPVAPAGVLALSRMVAVPREERALRHVSLPLRRQMRKIIDRGRWPALVTYSDEGQGHTGHVYKCSGWTKTRCSVRPFFVDAEGRRLSSYSNGKGNARGLTRGGTTLIQRWEHFACPSEDAATWMKDHGWLRIPVTGKKWKSGAQAFKWLNTNDMSPEQKLKAARRLGEYMGIVKPKASISDRVRAWAVANLT